jgi:hypothetical protein
VTGKCDCPTNYNGTSCQSCICNVKNAFNALPVDECASGCYSAVSNSVAVNCVDPDINIDFNRICSCNDSFYAYNAPDGTCKRKRLFVYRL